MLKVIIFLYILLLLNCASANAVYRNQEFGVDFVLPINEIKYSTRPIEKNKREWSFVSATGKNQGSKLNSSIARSYADKVKTEGWLFALVETDENGQPQDDIFVKLQPSNDSTESSRNEQALIKDLQNDILINAFWNAGYKVRRETRDAFNKSQRNIVEAWKGGEFYQRIEEAKLGKKVILLGHHKNAAGFWGITEMNTIADNIDFDATLGSSKFDIKLVDF